MQRERRKNNDILFHFRKDGLPMTKLSQLKIDPEFQKQINPPSFEETHQLEMNILKEERVLNPIITWNGYIVDGHTRYQVLRKYPFIPFEVIEKEFANRYEALVWICKNQLGRRNLTPEQKKFLIGKQVEAEKQSNRFTAISIPWHLKVVWFKMNQTAQSTVHGRKSLRNMEHPKVMFTVQSNLQKVWKQRKKQYPERRKKS